MNNELLIDYINIVRNYLNYSYGDKIEVSERNALTFFYISKCSNMKGKKLTDEETLKCITKGKNDKGICGIYMDDKNHDVLEVQLIKTRYINGFNKCSLTEKDMNETINSFKAFPYIKDCNEAIDYWQKRFIECKDKFKNIKIKFILLTNGYVSDNMKKKALENSIEVYDKEGAIFIPEAKKIVKIYKFEKLDFNELELEHMFNDNTNLNLRRIIMAYNLREKIITWLRKSNTRTILENLINKYSKMEVMNYCFYLFVKFLKFYDVKTEDERVQLLKNNFDKFINHESMEENILVIKSLEEPFTKVMELFFNEIDLLNSNTLTWNEEYHKALNAAYNKISV